MSELYFPAERVREDVLYQRCPACDARLVAADHVLLEISGLGEFRLLVMFGCWEENGGCGAMWDYLAGSAIPGPLLWPWGGGSGKARTR